MGGGGQNGGKKNFCFRDVGLIFPQVVRVQKAEPETICLPSLFSYLLRYGRIEYGCVQ